MQRHWKHSDFEDELQFHLEQSIAQKVAAGLSTSGGAPAGVNRVRRVERTREQCEQQRPEWLGTVLQDACYAVRRFRRNPLFTGSVVVTLALGIGATTAVFRVVGRPIDIEGSEAHVVGSCPKILTTHCGFVEIHVTASLILARISWCVDPNGWVSQPSKSDYTLWEGFHLEASRVAVRIESRNLGS